MSREQEWLRKLVEAYFNHELHPDLPLDDDDPNHPDDDRKGAVLSQVLDMPHYEPEECWRFLQIAADMPLSKDDFCLLGAGIFEDLMEEHGEQFIDRVEKAAAVDRGIRAVLDGVWTMSMKPDTAARIERIIGAPPA